jgi:golgi phosphoprotein 3
VPPKKNLHLHEEILLLALRDREGTIASGTWYAQAVAGALLAELMLDGHVSLTDKKVSARAARTGDELLDESLALIVAAKRRLSLGAWLAKLSGLRHLKRRAAESLCRSGILAADRKRVLRFFERQIYPELDHAPEQAVIERLRGALFGPESRVDPRTAVLVALAHHTGILRVVFDKKELERAKARIQRVIEGDVVGKAAQEAVQAIQAAILVGAVVAASV